MACFTTGAALDHYGAEPLWVWTTAPSVVGAPGRGCLSSPRPWFSTLPVRGLTWPGWGTVASSVLFREPHTPLQGSEACLPPSSESTVTLSECHHQFCSERLLGSRALPPAPASLRAFTCQAAHSSLSFVFQKTTLSHNILCGWFFPISILLFPPLLLTQVNFTSVPGEAQTWIHCFLRPPRCDSQAPFQYRKLSFARASC